MAGEFDVEAATKAGYSQSEIAGYLAGQKNFDLSAAKKAGYSDAQILGFLTTGKQPEPVGTLEDVGRAAASGAPRALTGMVGMPRATSDLIRAGVQRLGESSMPDWLKTGGAIMANSSPVTGMLGQQIGAAMPDTGQIRGAVQSVPGLGWTDYKPQTSLGRYTQAGVEGAASGAPFGVPGVVSGLMSGLGGEAGSDLTGGSMLGRLAGSFGAGMLPSAWQMLMGNRAAQLAQNATRDVTPDQFDQAAARQAAANAQGAPLTAGEALSNPQLLALQRNTETAPSSSNFMARWLRDRATQTQGAIRSEVRNIGPGVQNPGLTAAENQASAEAALNQARQGANAKAAQLYQASDASRIDSQTWNSLIGDPAMEAALKAVKKDPLLGLTHEPEGSMVWVDAAKKYLDAAAKPSMAAGPLERTAARGATLATNRVLPVVDAQVPAYPKARNVVAQAMEQDVAPLEAGPLGNVAKASTVKSQFSALTDPAQDVTPALASEAAQKLKMNDRQAFRDLMRSGLEQQLDLAASARTTDGTRVGERFYKSVFETPQTADNVRALLRELPDGKVRAAAFDNLMETLRLQANRMPGNSATAEKMATQGEALPNGLMKLAREPLKTSSEWIGRFFGGDANADLARIFTGQESVKELRRLAVTKPGSYQAGAIAASLLGASEQPAQASPQRP